MLIFFFFKAKLIKKKEKLAQSQRKVSSLIVNDSLEGRIHFWGNQETWHSTGFDEEIAIGS